MENLEIVRETLGLQIRCHHLQNNILESVTSKHMK